ncbi:hypothetical protein FRAHR75_1310015 [Frankia sp. Hr75.2]|nr:hypothetical protein FRAHR75_1310015 [Frankia sp. Hr75.2]
MEAGADAGEDVQVDAAGVELVLEEDQELLHGPGDDPLTAAQHQAATGVHATLEQAAATAMAALATVAASRTRVAGPSRPEEARVDPRKKVGMSEPTPSAVRDTTGAVHRMCADRITGATLTPLTLGDQP